MLGNGPGGFIAGNYDMFYPQGMQPYTAFPGAHTNHVMGDVTNDNSSNPVVYSGTPCSTYNNMGSFFSTSPQGFINPYFKGTYAPSSDSTGYSAYNYAINKSVGNSNKEDLDMYSYAAGRLQQQQQQNKDAYSMTNGHLYQKDLPCKEDYQHLQKYGNQSSCAVDSGICVGIGHSHVTSPGEPVNLSGK